MPDPGQSERDEIAGHSHCLCMPREALGPGLVEGSEQVVANPVAQSDMLRTYNASLSSEG